jgi:hypothetical protein
LRDERDAALCFPIALAGATHDIFCGFHGSGRLRNRLHCRAKPRYERQRAQKQRTLDDTLCLFQNVLRSLTLRQFGNARPNVGSSGNLRRDLGNAALNEVFHRALGRHRREPNRPGSRRNFGHCEPFPVLPDGLQSHRNWGLIAALDIDYRLHGHSILDLFWRR